MSFRLISLALAVTSVAALIRFDRYAVKKRQPFRTDSTDPKGPFTEDFQRWLLAHGYERYNFPRLDLNDTGSYGGKDYPSQPVKNTPIVFVHGNSDGALDNNVSMWSTGWSKSIATFSKAGYSRAELYATTWGDRNSSNAYLRTHNCKVIGRLRAFLEAVLAYTNARQIHVISHSMGVALARKAIRGGTIDADDGICDVGSSMRDRIKVFIGISGANFGMCQCSGGDNVATYPTCNKKNGFWPGEPCEFSGELSAELLCGDNTRSCSRTAYSQLLQEMNEDPLNEGEYVFSYWSYDDNLISYHDSVFGRSTSFIPFSNATKVYRKMNHMATKDDTTEVQYKLLTNFHF